MITAETRKEPSETAALAGLIHQLDKKEIMVVSSSLIKTEVLETDMTKQERDVFEGVIKRRSVVQLKDPNSEIMDISAKIRNYYRAARKNDNTAIRPPCTPDAIHLATAIYYECDKFFTLDYKDKKDSCGILKLTNPIANEYQLDLSKPYVEQAGLAV